MTPIGIDDAWTAIEAWLTTHAPAGRRGLRPGASPSEVDHAEQLLGVQLPEDYKASLERHDGQTLASPGLVAGARLLPVREACDQWLLWRDLSLTADEDEEEVVFADPGVRQTYWSPSWLPVVDRDGDGLMLETSDPAGPVVSFWHDAPVRGLAAPTFRAWLSALVADLHGGRMVAAGGTVAREGRLACWPEPDRPYRNASR
jgi:cell wall assembly regulator SMI1